MKISQSVTYMPVFCVNAIPLCSTDWHESLYVSIRMYVCLYHILLTQVNLFTLWRILIWSPHHLYSLFLTLFSDPKVNKPESPACYWFPFIATFLGAR